MGRTIKLLLYFFAYQLAFMVCLSVGFHGSIHLWIYDSQGCFRSAADT